MTNKELEKRVDELERKVDGLVTAMTRQGECLKECYNSISELDETIEILKDKLRIVYIQTKKEELEDKKPHHDFKVGDRVQFKSWKEMEEEFGLDGDGDIHLGKTNFVKRMKYLCGTYATIKHITDDEYIALSNFTAKTPERASRADNDWTFTKDMLKPVTDEPKCKFNVGDKVRVKDNDIFFGGKSVTILQLPDKVDDRYMVSHEFGPIDFFEEKHLEPYTEPRWTFTDDEKAILRNLPAEYKWIARDKAGFVDVYKSKPYKDEEIAEWIEGCGECFAISNFYNHLFQSIKWEDEVACEFRKYL